MQECGRFGSRRARTGTALSGQAPLPDSFPSCREARGRSSPAMARLRGGPFLCLTGRVEYRGRYGEVVQAEKGFGFPRRSGRI
jgi:hypothetical protein